MLTVKNILLLLLSTLSLNAWSYICQASDAYNFEGYSAQTLYDGYYLYNVTHNDYKTYQIVQNTPGDIQQEYWCLYQSDDLRLQHLQSCDINSGYRPICPITISGFIDGVSNFRPYLNPLTDDDCTDQDICIDIPQTLSVSVGDSEYDANTFTSLGVFLVSSNGWVDFEFRGTTITDDDGSLNTPYFFKPEVDASGRLNGRYDHLANTRIGVRVSNAELLKQFTSSSPSFNSWKLGSDHYGPEASQPMGTPEDFILPMSNPNSPGAAIGAFSPAAGGVVDSNQTAQVKVYATGGGYYSEQSGQYGLIVELVVTARER